MNPAITRLSQGSRSGQISTFRNLKKHLRSLRECLSWTENCRLCGLTSISRAVLQQEFVSSSHHISIGHSLPSSAARSSVSADLKTTSGLLLSLALSPCDRRPLVLASFEAEIRVPRRLSHACVPGLRFRNTHLLLGLVFLACNDSGWVSDSTDDT